MPKWMVWYHWIYNERWNRSSAQLAPTARWFLMAAVGDALDRHMYDTPWQNLNVLIFSAPKNTKII